LDGRVMPAVVVAVSTPTGWKVIINALFCCVLDPTKAHIVLKFLILDTFISSICRENAR
jgi:hypothetical protein